MYNIKFKKFQLSPLSFKKIAAYLKDSCLIKKLKLKHKAWIYARKEATPF